MVSLVSKWAEVRVCREFGLWLAFGAIYGVVFSMNSPRIVRILTTDILSPMPC